MKWPEDFENKILCGDCRELMKPIPDKAIDFLFADPPFFAKNMGKFNKQYTIVPDYLTDKNKYKKFCREWFEEARRISNRLVITPGIAHFHLYPEPIWTIAVSQPAAVKYSRFGGFNVWEPLMVYDKPLKRIPRDLIEYDCRNLNQWPLKKHPCPDNTDMIRWIIDKWAKGGDMVGDCFVGSGRTTEVAKDLGLRYMGMDIVPEYCEIARAYLRQQILQLK